MELNSSPLIKQLIMRKIRLYAGISVYPTLVDFGLCSGHTENVIGADNQQATPRKWESPQRLYAEYPTCRIKR